MPTRPIHCSRLCWKKRRAESGVDGPPTHIPGRVLPGWWCAGQIIDDEVLRGTVNLAGELSASSRLSGLREPEYNHRSCHRRHKRMFRDISHKAFPYCTRIAIAATSAFVLGPSNTGSPSNARFLIGVSTCRPTQPAIKRFESRFVISPALTIPDGTTDWPSNTVHWRVWRPRERRGEP